MRRRATECRVPIVQTTTTVMLRACSRCKVGAASAVCVGSWLLFGIPLLSPVPQRCGDSGLNVLSCLVD